MPEEVALKLTLLGVSWEWGHDIDPGHSRGGFRFYAGGRHIQTSPVSSILQYGWGDTVSGIADYLARARGVPIGWNDTTKTTMPKVDAAAVIEEDAFREQS